MASFEARVRRRLKVLEATPLHPQWLTKRQAPLLHSWLIKRVSGSVLDIGCGDGSLRSTVPRGTQYVSVDYPATRALGYTGKPDAFADAAQLPFFDGHFDCVILLDVLEHLPDPQRAISEAARVLRRGGRCLIHVPFLYPLHDQPHDYQRWTEYGLRRLLANNDLEVELIEPTASAVEAATSLLTIALAKFVVDAVERRSPATILAPLAISLVPLLNSVGWLLGQLAPETRIAPFSYRISAVRV